jgi:hypothetical protein
MDTITLTPAMCWAELKDIICERFAKGTGKGNDPQTEDTRIEELSKKRKIFRVSGNLGFRHRKKPAARKGVVHVFSAGTVASLVKERKELQDGC